MLPFWFAGLPHEVYVIEHNGQIRSLLPTDGPRRVRGGRLTDNLTACLTSVRRHGIFEDPQGESVSI